MEAKPEVNKSQQQSYIGNTLSILSKAKVRYIGTLIVVDPMKKTITLSKVRCLGTEGRLNGINEVQKSDEVHEQITFNANELDDFYVVKSTETFQDPAIVSSVSAKPNKEQTKDITYIPSNVTNIHNQLEHNKATDNIEDTKIQNPKKEFYDIEKMNSKFEALLKFEVNTISAKPQYDKSMSFFDNLNNESMKDQRVDMNKLKEQRKIDNETFGISGRGQSRYGRNRRAANYRSNRGDHNTRGKKSNIVYVKKE